ncbi:MAG TPA: serine hydrolase domain-containing protein [Hyphomicrobiaceae bacterium]|nr:serine hydrolase domain-containing protein [Hyphomicrobiaceae bacterium]
MTSRRDLLKAAAIVVASSSSIGLGHRRAGAQVARNQIDDVLRQGVEARDAAGVVAMAASDRGVLYEGAAGLRALDQPAVMTGDTVFRIASMTKAITSVAAMQLVEQGRLKLDEPVPGIDPTLASPQVLEGFDASGEPKLRPAKRPITLRHLLTHTAGFGYEQWDPNINRYVKTAGLPPRATGKLVTIRMPLVFDPGDSWLYGINTDWVGRLVEATSGQPLDMYFRDNIFRPLGMKDSGYQPTPEQRARQAHLHTRQPDGSLAPQPLETVPAEPEFWSGGGPLYSTPRDYLTFLQMLLHGGSGNGVQLLKPETVAEMHRNATGNIPCGVLKTEMPALSNDVNLFPGAPLRWGLAYMLNVEAGPNGRSAGTLSWGGLFNTYYWLDPVRKVTGLIMTQVLPFADPRVLKLYGRFESSVYEALKTG